MAQLIPKCIRWYKSAATVFSPQKNSVRLADDTTLTYQSLVVATGLKLDWDAIPGLKDSLGTHGITSNYAPGMAPYTW